MDNIGLAIITSLIGTIIFGYAFMWFNKKQKKIRPEIKLVEKKLKVKLKKSEKEAFLKVLTAYYFVLFFGASLVAFYMKGLLMLVISTLVIFIIGLMLAIYLLPFIYKRVTK